MKIIYLSLSLLLAFITTTSIANPVAIMQTVDVQCKLLNDSKAIFIYYVNGAKFEMKPGTATGLSFPANTIVKIIDPKTKKEKEFLKLTTTINGKTFLLSTLKK